MSVIDHPQGIMLYRFATMIAGLKLEIKGMTRRGTSCYAILKNERGYKGNKLKVLTLAQADYAKERVAF